MPNYSTIPSLISVITLGHKPNVPLMWSGSELTDGYEPHDHILLSVSPCGDAACGPCRRGGGVPGVGPGGYREGGIPGTSQGQIEAYLWISEI